MQIEQMPSRPMQTADWEAWVKTPDGFSIKIQISGRASPDRAFAIVNQMVGVGTPGDAVPSFTKQAAA